MSKRPKNSLHHKTDFGYAWIIVASSFIIYALIIGNIRSYGVVYVEILGTYNASREAASWPLSLLYAVMYFTGVISGILNNYFSTRVIVIIGCLFSSLGISLCFSAESIFHLSIFIGLIQGFGSGLVFPQIPIIINQYFVKLRGTACGFAFAGATIGAFLLPLFTEFLLEQYSIKGCFLVLGALTLNTIPAAMLLRPPTSIVSENLNVNEVKVGAEREMVNVKNIKCSAYETEIKGRCEEKILIAGSQTEDELSNKDSTSTLIKLVKISISLAKNPVYLTLCILHAVFMWSWTTFTLIIVDFAVDKGVEMNEAVVLLSAFAGFDLFGRLTSGYVSDKGFIKRTTIGSISVASIGLLSLAVPLVTNFTFFVLISFSLGVFTGALMILFSVLVVEFVEMEKVPIALGVSLSFYGFIALLRPEIIGYFRDIHNSYNGMFYVMGVKSGNHVGAILS
ncbi:monocarboxylate transporter-like protein [Dinothrombium tinctorium]|uniref:Monocarboxylate transporter-like protein n=1 Tax=Dinothrombium tinctorium TaxID=1965070 RepID=A0A3S3P0H1_9ACAR|nr:monocarboxylate transporter-like protein [Dinothrombium tinctorium]RWS05488.1 monocarboxylate transporter-like protein [Dinothrombium tinctorium]